MLKVQCGEAGRRDGRKERARGAGLRQKRTLKGNNVRKNCRLRKSRAGRKKTTRKKESVINGAKNDKMEQSERKGIKVI